MHSKRGQITVYIIIGIIALLSVSVFLYIRSAKVEAPVSYKPTIEQIPVEAEPIRLYVESCIADVAEDGLRRIGDYGGYYDIQDAGLRVNSFMPTEGDAVSFSPAEDSQQGMAIPYWWYMKSGNDCYESRTCQFSTQRPPLFRAQGSNSIESQLDKYVNENLGECLSSFTELSEFGFEISETGDINTRTVVTQKTVAFHVKYPLIAQKGGVTYNLNEYFVDLPLNLKEIYDLATDISNMEAKESYLEAHILNLISFYGTVDKDAIPPAYETDLDPSGGVMWMKTDVRERVGQMLASYIPLLRVTNTANFKPIIFPEGNDYSDAMNTIYNHGMHIPLINKSYRTLGVHFSSLDEWWPFYFDLNCNGELCRPEELSGAGDIMFFIQRYPFNYDLSVPVLVNINSPYAFNRRGYSFKFFLEANIRNNKIVASHMDENPIPDAEFAPTGSMLCDEDKRNSPNLTLKITDGAIGTDVEGAHVHFRCGSETCDMGETDEQGEFVSNYPVCIGGQLVVSKPGYQGASIPVNTDFQEERDIQFSIYEYMEIDVKIKKYIITKVPMVQTIATSSGPMNVTYYGWTFMPSAVSLDTYDHAIALFTRRSDTGELPFTTVADDIGDPNVEDNSKNMRIIPGRYDIEIFISNKDEMVIPEDEICVDIAGIDIKCTDLEEQRFNEEKPFFSGTTKINNVVISSTDLRNNNLMTLYAGAVDLRLVPSGSRKHKDADKATNIDPYVIRNKKKFLPLFETVEIYDPSRENRTVTLT